MKVVYWGTYDTGKPRTRILLRGLRENGVAVEEIHHDLWSGVEDKSQISGFVGKAHFLFKWLFCYPRLIFRYLKAPPHDVVVVGYLGHLDVLVIWPFARFRRCLIVWDAFLSLHDTVVYDRKLVGRYHPLSSLLYVWEALACRAAGLVLLDTEAHARFFIDHYRLPSARLGVVFVGAEPEFFPRLEPNRQESAARDGVKVLFYGQFIPLHGIQTIVEAARILEKRAVHWKIIGQGQQAQMIRELVAARPLENLGWEAWVDYAELADHIRQADICLGIFGDSAKAARVIPNKVFQVVLAGKPLVTRDSPAIRELLDSPPADVILVPPASPEALAEAIDKLADRFVKLPSSGYLALAGEITPKAIGRRFRTIIKERLTE